MSEYPEDSARLSRLGGDVYHDTTECIRIDAADRYAERSIEHVEWHDMDACGFCHDAVEHPGAGKRRTPLTLAKRVQHGLETHPDPDNVD